MKALTIALLGCLFVAAGIFLLVQGETVKGALGLVFGVVGLVAALVRARATGQRPSP